MSETQLVKSILTAVNYYGFFWRNNTGAQTINSPNGTRFIRFGHPGSADIIGIYKGRFVGIEAKASKGKQSTSQQEFELNIRKFGGYYILAYTIEDALNGLKEIKMNVDDEVSKLDGMPVSKKEVVRDLLNKALLNSNDEPLKLEIQHLKSKVAMLEEALRMKDSLSLAVSEREEEFIHAKKSKKKAN